MNKEKNKLEKAYLYILVFSVFANVYSIPSIGIGFGEIVTLPLLPFLIFDFINHKKIVNTPASSLFKIFLVYSLLVTLINAALIYEVDSFETIKRLIRCFYYFTLFCFFSKYYFEYPIAKKAMTIFSVLLAGFIIIQFVSYFFLGVYISGLIPGLSIDNQARMEHSTTVAEMAGYVRPYGFLGEPAHCAQTLALPVVLELFSYNGEKMNKLRLVLYIIAMLLTVSANAYAVLVVIALLWLYNGLKGKSITLSKFKVAIIAVILIIAIISLIDEIKMFSDVYERFETLDEASDNSAGLRLLRGPAFFACMEPLGQIFGIGFGNFLGYRSHFHIWTIYEEPDEYMNTISAFLVSTGIIGIFLLLLCICQGLKGKPFKNKALMIILIVLSFSSSIGYTPIWILYLSFALWGGGKNKDNPRVLEKHKIEGIEGPVISKIY